MKKYMLCSAVLMLLSGVYVRAQDSYNDRAQKYIERYYTLAIDEQKRAGIPASITLGQGILETEAGASELMTKANNHFGIKCKNDWGGDKFLHTDDAPMECFKKYKCAEESYKDHSDYLKRNPRYAKLFTLKTTDYKSWAVCLRNCGYATNPQYAQNLIKIIEDFKLQDYTYSALDSSLLKNRHIISEAADRSEITDDTIATTTSKSRVNPIQNIADSARDFVVNKKNDIPPSAPPPPDIDSSKIVTVNGMKAFYAHKGEMLLPYAIKYKIRYPRLLEMNDLPDGPLPFNTCVYLEKKQTLGARATHVVKDGESLLMISQAEGVQLKRLMAMNMLNPNEEPVTGSVLYLQSATAIKPEVKINAIVAHKSNAIVTGPDTTAKQDNDYIAINRSVTTVKPAVKKPQPVVADTTANHKVTPVAVNIPKPQPHADTAKPHTVAPAYMIAVKTPVEDTNPIKPVVVQPYMREKPVTPVEKQDATTEEEFTKLKAELDKVVYADDSKLVAKIESAQPQQKSAEEQAAVGAKYYTVKRGDTAFSIAKKNNITVGELLKLNDITASGVKVGKSLRIK
ncbi:MAG: glucosaminidase domain-containing protein [Chitinophagales bacterium]